jgi:hypothetical protein
MQLLRAITYEHKRWLAVIVVNLTPATTRARATIITTVARVSISERLITVITVIALATVTTITVTTTLHITRVVAVVISDFATLTVPSIILIAT